MSLNKIIMQYVNTDTWKKSLLVRGEWGVGKTHLLKNFFNSVDINLFNEHTHYCFLNGYEITNDFDLKRHIIDNSYSIGTSKFNPLSMNIISRMRNNYKNLNLPDFLVKSIEILDTSIKVTVKSQLGINLEINELISNFLKYNPNYFYKDADLKKCILIIDELDRNTMTNIKVIFSKIIDLLENFNLKIILVTNLNMNDSNFNDWAEKVISFKVNFKSQLKNIECIKNFSEEFNSYFISNIEAFSNYRSYETYLIFEKMIDESYSGYCDVQYKIDILNEIKETLFYAIFSSENPHLFNHNQDIDFSNIRANHIDYKYRHFVDDYISFNFEGLNSLLDDLLSDVNHKEKILIDSYNNYIDSKKVCHNYFRGGRINNPTKYIFDVINQYINRLILMPTSDVKKEPFNYLSYWTNELSLYDSEEEIKNIEDFKGRLYRNMKFKFDYNYYSQIHCYSSSDKIKFITTDVTTLVEPYIKYFPTYPEFTDYVTTMITHIKDSLSKNVLNNFVLEDDLEFLKYCSLNIDNFFEIAFQNSFDFERDVAIFQKHLPEWFDRSLSNYFIKYPNEEDRIIKFYFLDNIISKTKSNDNENQ